MSIGREMGRVKALRNGEEKQDGGEESRRKRRQIIEVDEKGEDPKSSITPVKVLYLA